MGSLVYTVSSLAHTAGTRTHAMGALNGHTWGDAEECCHFWLAQTDRQSLQSAAVTHSTADVLQVQWGRKTLIRLS